MNEDDSKKGSGHYINDLFDLAQSDKNEDITTSILASILRNHSDFLMFFLEHKFNIRIRPEDFSIDTGIRLIPENDIIPENRSKADIVIYAKKETFRPSSEDFPPIFIIEVKTGSTPTPVQNLEYENYPTWYGQGRVHTMIISYKKGQYSGFHHELAWRELLDLLDEFIEKIPDVKEQGRVELFRSAIAMRLNWGDSGRGDTELLVEKIFARFNTESRSLFRTDTHTHTIGLKRPGKHQFAYIFPKPNYGRWDILVKQIELEEISNFSHGSNYHNVMHGVCKYSIQFPFSYTEDDFITLTKILLAHWDK